MKERPNVVHQPKIVHSILQAERWPVKLICLPFGRVVKDVLGNGLVGGFIANDVFIIIALPQSRVGANLCVRPLPVHAPAHMWEMVRIHPMIRVCPMVRVHPMDVHVMVDRYGMMTGHLTTVCHLLVVVIYWWTRANT